MAFGWWFSLLVQLLPLVCLVGALDINFCSSDNTGSSFEQVQNTFQSNGACQDTCKSSYAYAVILRQNCWCSNYAPADNVNTLQCNDPCPGFPSEWCGSSSSGLYAYFQLTLSPSGTLAPSIRPSSTRQSSVSGSLTTESSSMRTFSLQASLSFQFEASSSIWSALTVITTQSTAQASTVQPTVTVTKPALSPSPSSTTSLFTIKVVSTTTDKTSTPTTLITSANDSEPSSTQAPSLVPSIITVTQNGTTITSRASVIPSPESTPGQAAPPPPSGLSAGRTAGIAVGAAVGLAAILGLTFWLFLWKKRRGRSRRGRPESDQGEENRQGLPRRHASQMSQAGLIDKNPRIITTGLPAGSAANSAGTPLSQSNRYSVGTDMRLNPNAIYTHEESQHSSVSLQDNRDYSRQLHVRNPDS